MKKIFLTLFLISVFASGIFSQSGWQVLNSGISSDLNGICFNNINTGYVCGDSGKILKTTNGGINWLLLNSSVTYELNDLCFVNINTGFCGGNSGVIKTTNSGGNWFTVSANLTKEINFVQGAVITGGGKWVYASTDYGQTWTNIFTGSSGTNIYTVFFNNKDTGQIMGYAGFQSKTTNGGSIWFSGGVWSPGEYIFYDCYFFDSGTGYGTYSFNSGYPSYIKSYGIFRCNYWNSGSSYWLNVYYNNGLRVYGLTFSGADTGYAVGGGYVSSVYHSLILKTTNGGNNWTQMSFDVNQVLNDLYFLDSKTGYVAGRNGTILKTENGGATGMEIITNEIPERISLGQNYPNPFNQSSIINFQCSMKSDVTLKVFDIPGREVATLVNENLMPGTYEVTFDAGALSSGIYFYRLTAGNFSETKKLIILK